MHSHTDHLCATVHMHAAVVSEGGEDPHIVGCTVSTPRFSINIEQVSGWERFQEGHEEAVSYYTWCVRTPGQP